ncbi:U4/U6 small nuclear ribonucleoprotein Prp4 [Phytophthora cactorum]|nr:U4/U6 small nuclear ribonucleoprotein Prp4 [Phytophthora cactorum]
MGERKGIYFGAIDASAGDMVPRVNLEAAIRAGNVNVSDNVETEVLQLSESSRAAQEKHAHLLRRIEAEKRARNIAVPTIVEEVIRRLRQLGEPITLFGERPADRRERLREILSRLELEAEETGFVHQVLADIQKQGASGGGSRAESTARKATKPQEDQLFYVPIKNEALKSAPELYTTALKMANVASQNGDVRPLASVRFSADGAHVATGSWSSLVKVWDATNANEVKVFRGHEDRVTGIAWHPVNAFSEMTNGADSVCLCSGSADGTARLWSAARNEPLAVLQGHKARLGKVAFHPLGNFVGTTSFDHTWRLWDVATAQELLLQEGHYKEVYAIAFQKDGALAATGDLNGNGRVWDLRSGKAILPLQGHSKQILSMDFAANGVQLASGSDDRSVRIWDLRQQKCSYMIPAHSNLVSDVRFSPGSSELLLSASYDSSIKLWRTRDWKLMTTLRGHDGKCSLEAQQFSVVVATSAPLGLRLSEKLEVLEFVADSEGRGRAVEASGLAEIGDRLIAVNDWESCKRRIATKTALPDPRWSLYPTPPAVMKESVIEAETASTVTYEPPTEEIFDYVVSSVGDKATELKLYAVLSSDGSPPSCAFRELVLARPFDACAPLSINVTDKYVLVPSVFGCPMHQKAALADEAGAKGVVFVQRVGEKPMRVLIPPPSSLPHPINIPLVMVSTDTGARLLEQMVGARPGENQQLRFVFSSTCAVDRFAVHPDDNDPLRRSAAFLIEDASAGFLSISVATSAETELIADTYEFLKPADYSSAGSSAGVNLPIGRHDLIFPDPKVFNPCETDPMRISPLSRHGSMVNSFIAIRLRDPKSPRGCSLMRQLAYFEARRAAGIILGDQRFPHAASSLTAAVAVQQTSIPIVFISINAFRTVRYAYFTWLLVYINKVLIHTWFCSRKLRELEANAKISSGEDSNTHIHVEFSGENGLEHQWKELASLAVASNWPATEAARDRLFHRMLKDQASLDDHDMHISLVKNERYEALVASYWNAQRYYSARADDAAKAELEGGNDSEDDR